MRSADPMLVPPNFMTRRSLIRGLLLLFCIYVQFEVLCRTILRMASSTCSGARPVESTYSASGACSSGGFLARAARADRCAARSRATCASEIGAGLRARAAGPNLQDGVRRGKSSRCASERLRCRCRGPPSPPNSRSRCGAVLRAWRGARPARWRPSKRQGVGHLRLANRGGSPHRHSEAPFRHRIRYAPPASKPLQPTQDAAEIDLQPEGPTERPRDTWRRYRQKCKPSWPRERSRDGALACSGGSVNRDDDLLPCGGYDSVSPALRI